MSEIDRRKFLKMSAGAAGAGAALNLVPPLIRKALAVKAHSPTKTIHDVQHVVILMQENRSFDHYFGAMRGVRGFGDRFPIPLESGKRAFVQSDGKREYSPYRADKKTVNAALVNGTPHDFPDTQAAWNQGKYGFWPMFKTPYSMAYYTREEIPFQYALAEAFTISDAYHCSVATGTDPNRIVFWSGANADPEKRAAGINCTDADSEPVNLRCWVEGKMPDPGYTYRGNAFKWDTIPDVLQKAGVSWRIYQDPNDNWTGAMHGCLAFESFRTAKPGSPVYENGMKHWSIRDLTEHVKNNTLPQVSWVLPSQSNSEHPSGPSSPNRGGDFTHQVLTAITANPEVWSKTVFFLTFDENDGLFDHLPAPAVPSYNTDGSLAGKSTIDLAGMYFNNDKGSKEFPNPFYEASMKKGGPVRTRIYQDKRDTITGNVRPWGMGPRVPMYIISPWSKGGWVNSEVADHTSVGQFLEKRFNVVIPAISPWHRSVSSDLTSAFDFVTPNDPVFPPLPETADYVRIEEASRQLPKATAPESPGPLFQEKGTRYSRALPYHLHTHAKAGSYKMELFFENKGAAGVVFHVYDLKHLDRIPRRYTVEAGKSVSDEWGPFSESDGYGLEVFGPNGYFRRFSGNSLVAEPEVKASYDQNKGIMRLEMQNSGKSALEMIVSNSYNPSKPLNVTIPAGKKVAREWTCGGHGNWYDLTVQFKTGGTYQRRLAGRIETGKHGISDPAMAMEI
ncbi:phospholipase C [Dyadobacter sp. BE34]|uniref:phospholipase C n=1 Tax=Dyadobacter fermentans TaxID=94254 RepID=A0ABU1QX81_9BACT|nr:MULTISPECIES: phospholipase C, phosphocholine-specific [Dyadobacter]MDR6805325.1 phospholipase C [Dyadobacter fermentans]MDR7042915.1 phospholipase C [Dyadobacter sp. BE242]MDR7197227.1 phospholipase C [Dyadobacter sp. BE34]MDR7215338.1 phospholipase C [Dyadobacter sp. BE31]MDR7262874.1 phospholipase C [Dyadobacter sp. BE32]